MSTFNPGDVVRLKSGGPKMTVRNKKAPHVPIQWNVNLAQGYAPSAPHFDRPVTCDWFAHPEPNEEHRSATFEEEALVAVSSDPEKASASESK